MNCVLACQYGGSVSLATERCLFVMNVFAGAARPSTVNVYKYIFCMYSFLKDLQEIDVIFIYCSGFL